MDEAGKTHETAGQEEPSLRFACLCDNVIEDKEGVFSLIRIVDRVTVAVRGYKVPEKMPAVRHKVKLAVGWTAGVGRHSMNVRITTPSGAVKELQPFDFALKSVEQNQNFVGDVNLVLSEQGLYWIEVLLNGRVRTRLPWRIVYEPEEGAALTPVS